MTHLRGSHPVLSVVTGKKIVDKTLEKLSTPTYDLITAAGVDLESLIHGAGEAWIMRLKEEQT